MFSSFWLLTATCLANGPAPVPYPGPETTPAPYCAQCAEQAEQEHGLGLGQRLADWFHGRRRHTVTSYETPRIIYDQPLPPEPHATPTPAITPVMHRVEPPARAEEPQEHIQRIAIADDASWVIGQLTYVHADGGLWVVRYAPFDHVDRFGGAVVLAAGPDMSKFREGDIVYVKGEVVNEGRASKHLGGPLYRATSIELNERPGE